MKTEKFQSDLMQLQSNMLNFAFLLTSNRDDAYDLLQDTTLRALDNKEKFAAGSNLKSWVFTIMRNIFINDYRRAAHSAKTVDISTPIYSVELTAGAEAPEESYCASEISEAIDGLSVGFRLPFTMHVAGYRYEEIAERMDLPVGTVKSRIHTARQRLQTRFADYV